MDCWKSPERANSTSGHADSIQNRLQEVARKSEQYVRVRGSVQNGMLENPRKANNTSGHVNSVQNALPEIAREGENISRHLNSVQNGLLEIARKGEKDARARK